VLDAVLVPDVAFERTLEEEGTVEEVEDEEEIEDTALLIELEVETNNLENDLDNGDDWS
jgi:hypothetical protein